MKTFHETDFVIFDVETTGLSPRRGDRIIEIAGIKIQGLRITRRFHSLVNPLRPVSYGAFLVNGISDGMLEGAPAAENVLPQFLDFSGDACLVAHNIPFDMGFLAAELERAELIWSGPPGMLDTVRMARRFLPGLKRYSLLSLAQFFEVGDSQDHRAMADAEMTFGIFCKLLEMAERRDIYETEALMRWSGKKRKESRVCRREP